MSAQRVDVGRAFDLKFEFGAHKKCEKSLIQKNMCELNRFFNRHSNEIPKTHFKVKLHRQKFAAITLMTKLVDPAFFFTIREQGWSGLSLKLNRKFKWIETEPAFVTFSAYYLFL